MSDQAAAVPAGQETVSPAAEVSNQAGQGAGAGSTGGGQAGGSGGDVAAGSGQPRDEGGRFAKSADKRPLGGTLDDIPDSDFEPSSKPADKKQPGKTPLVAKPIPAPAAPAPPPARFKFAGKDYDTQEQAEQAHRTLQGMFKPQQDTITRLQAELATLRAAAVKPAAGVKPADAPAAASAKPTGPMDGIDLALYKQIASSQGPEAAAYWLQQEVIKSAEERFEARLKSELEAVTAPLRKQHEQGQMLQLAEGLFNELASYTTPDAQGNPAPTYPELYDGDAAERIGHLWANLPIPTEARNSPTGMYLAVCVYRDQLRAGVYGPAPSLSPSSQPQQPGNPAPQVPAVHPGSAEAAAAVAAALGRTPSSPEALTGGYPVHRGNGTATEADVIRAGIDKAREIGRLTGVPR